VTNQGDGWTWSLEELRLYYEAHTVEPAPAALIEASRRPILLLSEEPLPEVATACMSLYLEAVATLGRRTAEMHLALAAQSEDPAFQPQRLDKSDLSLLAHQFRERASDALDALKSRLATLPDDLVELVGLLLARRRQVLEAFRRLEETEAVLQKTRIHGDFHLGQVLRARGDSWCWTSRASRRARRKNAARCNRRSRTSPAWCAPSATPPRRAGQLSSKTAAGRRHPGALGALVVEVRLGCVSGQLPHGRGRRGFSSADSNIFARLLDAFLVDKAFYELGYELDHRPTWARIPLQGLLALVREPVGER